MDSTPAGPQPAAPADPDASRIAAAARGVVSLMVIVLIFSLLLKSIDLADVLDAIGEVNLGSALLLVLAMVGGEAFKARIPAAILPQLGHARSFVAEETSGVMSKALPGPSGTAARFAIYRSFGISSEDFGTCTVVNSLVNNGFVLAMPAVAIGPYLLSEGVPGPILVIAVVGVALSITGLAVVGAIARSEALAHRLGSFASRVAGWVQRIRKKPRPADLGPLVGHVRDTTVAALARSWRPLVPLMLGKYVINAAVLVLAMRAAGLDASELSFYEIFAVQVFTGILTMIEVTPGGLGVTEVVLIKLFSGVTGGADDDAIVAGVVLFRCVTYLGPMLLGAGSYFVWRRRSDWRSDHAGAPPALATADFAS